VNALLNKALFVNPFITLSEWLSRRFLALDMGLAGSAVDSLPASVILSAVAGALVAAVGVLQVADERFCMCQEQSAYNWPCLASKKRKTLRRDPARGTMRCMCEHQRLPALEL